MKKMIVSQYSNCVLPCLTGAIPTRKTACRDSV
jgi:hypothetical protein